MRRGRRSSCSRGFQGLTLQVASRKRTVFKAEVFLAEMRTSSCSLC